jgi:hypothetical protein
MIDSTIVGDLRSPFAGRFRVIAYTPFALIVPELISLRFADL